MTVNCTLNGQLTSIVSQVTAQCKIHHNTALLGCKKPPCTIYLAHKFATMARSSLFGVHGTIMCSHWLTSTSSLHSDVKCADEVHILPWRSWHRITPGPLGDPEQRFMRARVYRHECHAHGACVFTLPSMSDWPAQNPWVLSWIGCDSLKPVTACLRV